jgi:hypothetical protein
VLKGLTIGIIAFSAAILIGSMTMQHQVFAPRGCGGCITQFQILTRSFGADAGKILLTDKSVPISSFIQLNLKFDKDIIKAVYAGHAFHPGDPVIPELVNQYGEDLLNLHPPDPIKPLLQSYQQDVLQIFFPTT